jgi:FMN reductase
MPQIIALSGSPSPTSKSARLLQLAVDELQARDIRTEFFSVREVPAEDLFHARFDCPAVQRLAARIAKADGVVIASPIYKASYPGVLKALLDLLPQKALQGKTVLPLATGGSAAHLLAIDYAFKPVFAALGATHLLAGVYVTDAEFASAAIASGDGLQLPDDIRRRLHDGVTGLVDAIRWQEHLRAQAEAGLPSPVRRALGG